MQAKCVGFFGGSGAQSGSGIRNALEWWRAGKTPSVIPYAVISCNDAGGVAKISGDFNLPLYHFRKPYDEAAWQRMWEVCRIDYLVLLGCSILVKGLQDKTGCIINEHPALLSLRRPEPPYKPLFGGKGMTDLKVHEKVIRLREPLELTHSGTTTHFVVCNTGTDDDYDAGGLTIREHRVALRPGETPVSLQESVKQAQRVNTPQDIEDVVSGRIELRKYRSMGGWVVADRTAAGPTVLRTGA